MRERQILADLEQHFRAEDPRLAAILGDPASWPSVSRYSAHPVRRPAPVPPARPTESGRDGAPIWAALLLVVAVALVVAGVAAPIPPTTAAVMLTGGVLGVVCGLVSAWQLWRRHRRV